MISKNIRELQPVLTNLAPSPTEITLGKIELLPRQTMIKPKGKDIIIVKHQHAGYKSLFLLLFLVILFISYRFLGYRIGFTLCSGSIDHWLPMHARVS